MTSTSPLFILSCERSGSTLLRYILDTHPDICCPGELYLGQLIKDLRLTVSRTTGLDAANAPDQIDGATRQEIHQMLNELLLRFAQGRGKKIWCDKTPANLKNLNEIVWAFPEARFICLYRNSLDVIHSCLEVRQRGLMYEWTVPYVANHMRNFVAAMMESWVEKTEIALTFEAQHPHTCRIQYETLTQEPAKALAPLFQFLGLTWDPALLDKVFEVKHDRGLGDSKIESTHQIERDRIGQGAKLDPTLLASIPPNLKQRQAALSRQLGYV